MYLCVVFLLNVYCLYLPYTTVFCGTFLKFRTKNSQNLFTGPNLFRRKTILTDPKFSIDFSNKKYKNRYQRLMNILFHVGELPSGLWTKMNMSYANYAQAVFILRKRNMIQTINKDGLVGYRLSLQAKRSVNEPDYEQYKDCVDDVSDRHLDKARRRRRRSYAFLYALLDRAGIPYETFRKPKVIDRNVIFGNDVYFYTALDIKRNMGAESTAITGSIMHGLLVGKGRIIPVYKVYHSLNTKFSKHEAVVPYILESHFRVSASAAILICPFDSAAVIISSLIIDNVTNAPKDGLNTGHYKEFYTVQDDDRFLGQLYDLYRGHTESEQEIIEQYDIDTADKDWNGRYRYKAGTGFIDDTPALVCAGNVDLIKLKRFVRNAIVTDTDSCIFCKQRDLRIVSEIVKDAPIDVIEI